MTSLKTISEEESKEERKINIKVNEFYIRYHYEGKEYELRTHDLKEFFSIYLVGINDN